MKKALISAGAIGAVLVPGFAFAQVTSLCDLTRLFLSYFNIAVIFILGLCVVVFVFNIFRYFFTTQENSQRGMYLLWSLIGFFVILSFWGLVNLVAGTFKLNNNVPTTFGNVFGGGTTSCGTVNNQSSSSGTSGTSGTFNFGS
jgi:hypothetical protein